MKCIRFNYLYRDGANFKAWGEVIFLNPEKVDKTIIAARLSHAFLPDNQFVASQISIPEVFLFQSSKITPYDHCFHEFDSVELCDESPTDTLNRSIEHFVHDVETIALSGWVAFDIRAVPK